MHQTEYKLNENNILYELLIFSEWPQEFDNKSSLVVNSPSPSKLLSPWKLFKKSQIQNDSRRFLQNDFQWHIAISQDAKVIAVLQDNLVEIRTAKDEFSSVISKASVTSDGSPQLRHVTWSPDSTVLAVAHDSGAVSLYNLLGCNISTIPAVENYNDSPQPVVGLMFLQSKSKSTKWSSELLVVYFNGIIRSYLLPAFDGGQYEENIKTSLQSHYHSGLTAAAYDKAHHLLLVAGPTDSKMHGITVWRLLNDQPYLKLAFDSPKMSAGSRSLFKYLPGFAQQGTVHTVTKMEMSPSRHLLACLHASGEVSLWHLPGVRPHKRWPLLDQPERMINSTEHNCYPVDICWWSDTAIVIARRSGAISVCSIDNLENLLGDAPVSFSGPVQVTSVHGDRAGFLALECEVAVNQRSRHLDDTDSEEESETSVLQASIQAALYSITDIDRFQPKRRPPRLVQRTYRLAGLKSTTPEELYARKIDNEDFNEALILAQTYNLDCDLVYQRQWRNSNVSIDTIRNYLEKVSKRVWVAGECVQRVPDTAVAAKELLLFGLKITNVVDERLDDDELDSDMLKLISFRQKVLVFLDNLTIYERIIGSPEKYNGAEFDEFRRQPAIASAVKFARNENWQAVAIMFTYRGEETLPHWLPVLSNIPETLPPFHYRSLLPDVSGQEVVPWETKTLRKPDWCEKPEFLGSSTENDKEKHCDVYLYSADSSLRQFQASVLTPGIVEEWFTRRAYQVEQNTGLVSNALMLIKLAREKNVSNLDRLYFDLLTLESLVYVVQDEGVSFSVLKQLTHLEQVKLILTKTNQSTFVSDLKDLVVPFAARCEKLGCDTLYSLVKGLLMDHSKTSLELPLELMKYLKEDHRNSLDFSLIENINLALDCIYCCSNDDQIENCYAILECLPQRSDSSTPEEDLLHEKIDLLEKHLEACETLQQYQVRRTVNFIANNINNELIARELLEAMANHVKSETLCFDDLLEDLLMLHSQVFTCLDSYACYEIFVMAQLSCECEEIIESASDTLSCRKGEVKKISFDNSVALVLAAARNHFEISLSFDDPSLKYAETCLRLINEPLPEIHEELDLIESVQLLGVFNVRMLPLQVRLCPDRLKLIETCLESKPDAYKSSQRLLQLAQTLRVFGDDRNKREGEVLSAIARRAIAASDLVYCSELCNRLVTRNYSPAWTIVKQLGEADGFDDLKQKQLFLAFAILHCPIESVEHLLTCRIESRHVLFPAPPPSLTQS